LSSSLVYKFAGETLRPLAEILSLRLTDFSNQDDTHARLLQSVLWKLLDKDKEKSEDVGINPFIVSGVVPKRVKKKRDGKPDPMGDFKEFMQSLPALEAEFLNTLNVALADPDLCEKTAPILYLEELKVIGEDRLLILGLYNRQTLDGRLFSNVSPSSWSCLSCGRTVGKQKIAPELCPCCGAPQSMFKQGGWGLW